MEAYAMYFIDLILHLDKHLPEIMMAYGHLIYAILFMVVFCETGLVVTPCFTGRFVAFSPGGALCCCRTRRHGYQNYRAHLFSFGCAGRRLQLYDRRASRYTHD